MNMVMANRIAANLTTAEEDVEIIRMGLAFQSPQRVKPVRFKHPDPPRPHHEHLGHGCYRARKHGGCE